MTASTGKGTCAHYRNTIVCNFNLTHGTHLAIQSPPFKTRTSVLFSTSVMYTRIKKSADKLCVGVAAQAQLPINEIF